MTAMNQNFSMYAGDTKVLQIQVLADKKMDLNAVSVKWGLVKKDGPVILLKTTPAIQTANNTITITLLPEDTKHLLGDYNHECEITDPEGVVSTVTNGTVTIKKDLI